MKKVDLGQTITILANVGVIAGIAFLAFELRQNNELMAEEAQRARAQSVREIWGDYADNAEVIVKDLNGETLTAAELLRMNALWMSGFFGYQTSFQQLPREEIEGNLGLFRQNLETLPSFGATWEQYRETFRPEFIRYMDENVFDP